MTLSVSRAAVPDLDAIRADFPILNRVMRGGSRLAYLAHPDQQSTLLAQTLAAARHVAVQSFHQREPALHWLLQGP